MTTNHHKIFQVRYRNPRQMLEIFWAEDVIDFGASFRFTGCRIMRIATIEGTGMFKNYRESLGSIMIPNTLGPTSRKCDVPEWWYRNRDEAEAELQRMAEDPIANETDEQIRPFTKDLCEWLQQSSLPENGDPFDGITDVTILNDGKQRTVHRAPRSRRLRDQTSRLPTGQRRTTHSAKSHRTGKGNAP